jgi:urease accessory protein
LTRIGELNSWILQTRETAEMRQQTEQMGRSFIEWLRSVRPQMIEGIPSPLTYPLACALAVSALPGPPRQPLIALAFGWAENMMQAAIKAVPLGQSSGQRILSRLASEIPRAVDHAINLGEDDRQAFAPRLAILSSQHEIQYSRLFRS